jgi:hypothetical protein
VELSAAAFAEDRPAICFVEMPAIALVVMLPIAEVLRVFTTEFANPAIWAELSAAMASVVIYPISVELNPALRFSQECLRHEK